jgi:beta-lactamase regulating signal transducer with metallopeptidase domain
VSEAVFPLLGPLLVFLVVLPAAAIVVKIALVVLDRWCDGGELHTYQGLRYVLLVASGIGPIGWFLSASLHQAESGRSSSICSASHAANAFCPEAEFFALALVCSAAAFATFRLRRRTTSRPSASLRAQRAAVRILKLVRSRPSLAMLVGRIDVFDDLEVPIGTLGMLRPRVAVRTDFAEELDSEALAGALLHEIEHVRDRDPLRYFVAYLALAVNPIGRLLLDKELAWWLLAREVHCDREAVLDGAYAAALAQAIVIAARPPSLHLVPGLGPTDSLAVKLRVNLLLAYDEHGPHQCCRQPVLRFALCALLFVVLLPHAGSTGALDAVHMASERAAILVAGD